MKDNKGFSLIELIIVLAIMAVLANAMFYSYTLLSGQYARECANDLSTALEKEKNYALTRSASVDCYLELVKDKKSYYVRYFVPKNAIATGVSIDPDGNVTGTQNDWVLAEEKKIGNANRTEITCVCGSDTITVKDDTSIKFIYDRSSGAMKGIVKSNGADYNVEADGTITGKLALSDAVGTITDIKWSNTINVNIEGGRKYQIQIYTGTGKHELSRVG